MRGHGPRVRRALGRLERAGADQRVELSGRHAGVPSRTTGCGHDDARGTSGRAGRGGSHRSRRCARRTLAPARIAIRPPWTRFSRALIGSRRRRGMLGRAGSERWTRSRRSSRNSRMRRLPSLLSTSLPLLILYCTYLPISPFSFGISVRGRALEGLSLCSYKRCLCQINRISGQSSVPLDVLLLHGHALALPYPHFPTLCFLAYLSPRAYLSIQRSAPVNAAQQLPSIDIPSITVSTRILHPEVSLVRPSFSYHLNRPHPPRGPTPSFSSVLSTRAHSARIYAQFPATHDGHGSREKLLGAFFWKGGSISDTGDRTRGTTARTLAPDRTYHS